MPENLKTAFKVAGVLLGVYAYTKAVYYAGFVKGGIYVVEEGFDFINRIMEENREQKNKWSPPTNYQEPKAR